MNKLPAHVMAAIVLGLSSAVAIGGQPSLKVRPGYEAARGPRPRPQPRSQAKDRLAAAEAKRQQRQARNLEWQARGAFA